MNAREVAAWLGITISRVYRVVREGDLPAHDVRGRLLIRRIDAKRYKRRRDAWLAMHGRGLNGRAREFRDTKKAP